MNLIEQFLNWSVVGLLYDIAGVVALSFALFLNSTTKISEQAGTYFNFNPHALKNLAEQKVDARLGVTLLVVGFAFQVFGQWSNKAYSNARVAALAILILVVVVYVALRRRMVGRVIKAVKENIADRSRT